MTFKYSTNPFLGAKFDNVKIIFSSFCLFYLNEHFSIPLCIENILTFGILHLSISVFLLKKNYISTICFKIKHFLKDEKYNH